MYSKILLKTTMHVATVCKITNVSGNLQNIPVRNFAKQFNILSIIFNSENTNWLYGQNIDMHVCVVICTRSGKVTVDVKHFNSYSNCRNFVFNICLHTCLKIYWHEGHSNYVHVCHCLFDFIRLNAVLQHLWGHIAAVSPLTGVLGFTNNSL